MLNRMDFHSNTLSYRGRRMNLLLVVLAIIKLLKVISVYATYDLLKSSNPLTLLIAIKFTASLVLLPLQKPFNGPKLKITEWFYILKYSFVRIIIDALWIEGLILCGPFRFILLFEHSELLILASASTFIFGSQCTKKTRGSVFFVIGVLCLVFFDHDYTHGEMEHPEGVHKSFLIHHLYEMFVNFGLSDHKVGVAVLISAVCMDAGLAAISRRLVVAVGGSKRLYSISALTSVVLLIPLLLLTHLYNGYPLNIEEQSDLLKITEQAGNHIPSDKSSKYIQQRNWIFWIVYTSIMHVIDFYMTSLVSGRLGAHPVTRLAKLIVVTTSLIFSLIWTSSDSIGQFVASHHNDFLVNSFLLQHKMSVGVIVAVVCILYASDLLTTDKSGYAPDGISSGHFIGYSMAGLPLFTAGQTPTHGTTLLANSEEFGLWYHLRATFHGILTGKASRRIFAFLCLNLAFTFVELFYGVWTNSLGLISDGFHMLFDSAALVVGLYAAVVSHWKPTRVFSYGYNSAEILSGLVNALFLLVISGSVFVNAVVRIHQPPDIKTDKLLAVSILGLLVNIVGVVALGHAHSHGGHGHCHSGHGHSHGGSHGHSHGNSSHGNCHNHEHAHSHGSRDRPHSHHSDHKEHSAEAHDEELHYGHTHGQQQFCGSHKSHKAETDDANLRGVYLHVLADTLGSVSVIFSSFLVTTYGWNVADPICSMFIACVIGYSAMPLLNDTLGLLTLRVPDEFRSQLMVKKILQVDEVVSVSNPFIWTHTHKSVCVCVTVRIQPNASEQVLLRKIKELIQSHFSVSHLTIQVEKEDFEYHTKAMGLNLSVIEHYPKSFINSAIMMNGLTHANNCNKFDCLSGHANSLSVKDV
ncbi:hypothetical protein MN116_002801 [Schistosoma mekongi]|uniref:Proton-coupled zinc antiporter SLC30A5 n=1 Tax=Schistosoma mekongi TaxID=38744 RepID=A0AAE1ZG67_SCHME|nr:hypothetical protein MN116_002801 [Schistosoma mekongi]